MRMWDKVSGKRCGVELGKRVRLVGVVMMGVGYMEGMRVFDSFGMV